MTRPPTPLTLPLCPNSDVNIELKSWARPRR